VRSSSPPTACGGCFAVTVSTRARNDSAWSPATPPPTSRRARRRCRGISRCAVLESWSGSTAFFVGRLRGSKHPVWQVTAIDCYSSYGWADLITCPTGQPLATQTSRLARRVATDLARCGWQLERILSDNGNEFKGSFDKLLDTHHIRHTRIRPGRPQTNGHVENLHKTILDECWRPSFARYLHIRYGGLRADLAEYLHTYNTDRAHTGRLTQGRIPADILDPAHKLRPRP
jgi:transposase InsO family protein